MPKIEPFEEHTSTYDNWFVRHRFVYESELEAIRTQLPQSGNGIEIGVGTGRFAAPFGIKFGLDPSHKMSLIAQKRGIHVIRGVAEALPLKSSTFDFVLMVTTICFVDDVVFSVREINRILKASGSLIIGFIDKSSRVGKMYETHRADDVFYRVATFYTIKEVIYILRKTGFKDLGFVQTIFKPLPDIDKIEPVKPGYGEGSFVVIRALK